MTPMQYKELIARGQIVAPARPIAIPTGSQIGIMASSFGTPAIGGVMIGGSQVQRQARRVYVGGIPFGVTEEEMLNFFNDIMISRKLSPTPGNPIIAVQINVEKNFAFLEMRGAEDATIAMGLDGIEMNGQVLKLRRPKDYVALPGVESSTYIPGVVSTNVGDGPNKVYVGNLPTFLNDDQVKELLQAFGPLKSFNLVKDSLTGFSKGFAFCEFVDASITDTVCKGLHDMAIGDKNLVVQRAALGSKTGLAALPIFVPATVTPFMMPGVQMQSNVEATRILVLLNMVTKDELIDNDEYSDIVDDIREECSKFGKVISLDIPRPIENVDVPGLGKVFVEFETKEQALEASNSLGGRSFASRVVVTSFLDEQKYADADFS